MANYPNFIIAGAPKCGSTTLFQLLEAHPDIYFPEVKEPGYFIANYYKTRSTKSPNYKRQFDYLVLEDDEFTALYEGREEKVLGDASISYLFQSEEAVAKIAEKSGTDTKILFILREPFARLKSQFRYITELGFEHEHFSRALELESERMEQRMSSIYAYKGQSLYAEGIAAFMKVFPAVKVVFLEDLKRDAQAVVNEVCEFLEIGPVEVNLRAEANVSGTPKNRTLHRLILHKNPLRSALAKGAGIFVSRKKLKQVQEKLRKLNQTQKKIGEDPQREDLPAFMLEEFSQDQATLEQLIGRNVPY